MSYQAHPASMLAFADVVLGLSKDGKLRGTRGPCQYVKIRYVPPKICDSDVIATVYRLTVNVDRWRLHRLAI